MPAFSILSGGGSTTVVNDLTTGGTSAALSAEQGRVIGNQIRPGGNVATIPEFTSRQALVTAITNNPQVGIDIGNNFTRVKVKAYYTTGPYVDIDYVVTGTDPTANDSSAVALGGSKWLTQVASSGYVTPTMFGANGAADEGSFLSAMINYCHATGVPGYIDKPYNIGAARSISAKTFRLYGTGAGTLNVSGTNTLTFSQCNNSIVTNVNVKGNLSSETQYSTFKTGVTDAFQSMTFTNGSSTVDGSDFTHTLSGNLLTVSLGTTGANSSATRNCVSTLIPLGTTKTFCISLLKGWVTGDGANQTTFELFDASNALIGEFDPLVDSTPFTSNIKNAASLRITVGARRYPRTASGLTCVYDLSKIIIHECVNEMHSLGAAEGTPGTAGMVHITQCDNFVWDGGLLSHSRIGAMKLINSTNCLVKNTKIQFVFQGITTQSGTGNAINNNDIDIRFRTTGGELIGNKAVRNRCIGSSSERVLFVQNNRLRGASWAIETVGNSTTRSKQWIQGNTIEAEYCGISSTQGDGTVISDNIITLSPIAFCGVEFANVMGECTAANNTITCEDITSYIAYGITVSVAEGTVNLVNNTIYATIGAHLNSVDKINMLNNVFRFGNFGARVLGVGDFLAKGNRWELVRVVFPYGVNSETLGVQSNSASNKIEIIDNYFDATPGTTLVLTVSAQVLIANNFFREDGRSKGVTNEHYLTAASTNTVRILNNTTVNSSSTYFYLPINSIGAGSKFVSRNNTINDVPDDYVEADNAYVYGKQSTYGSVTFNPGSLAANAVAASNGFTVYGVAVGDIVQVIPPGALGAIMAYGEVASVSGLAATVVIRVHNPTNGALSAPGGTWGVLISKR